MISGSNEQLQQQLEYTLLKHDCHTWWISKMQSGRQDTLEERYAIKFCFKLGKNDATETYGMLQAAFQPSCMNRTSVFEWHKRFKEGRDDERCVRSKEVNTPELIGQRIGIRVTFISYLGHSLGGFFLLLCRDAVVVFYSPSWLGYVENWTKLWTFHFMQMSLWKACVHLFSIHQWVNSRTDLMNPPV